MTNVVSFGLNRYKMHNVWNRLCRLHRVK